MGRRLTRRVTLTGLAGGILLAPLRAFAETASADVKVDSLEALQAAIDKATPGTRLVLAAGTYDAGKPITIANKEKLVIAAERVGAATIAGPAGFVIDHSSYVTLQGFRLTGGATLSIPVGSTHVRITRNHFELTAGDGKHWLNVDGDDAEVDHNTFANKSNLGVYLSVVGPSNPNEVAKRVHIHHNYFFNHTFTGDNGGEPIRLGLSSRQSFSAYAVVEKNLFHQCNGDPEAISVKSSDNIVRYNTVVNSVGGIVLRHGNRTRVEGNIIYNGTNGIRFYGNDHVIVNNQVSDLTGTGLTIGSGSVIDDTASTGNDRPDRVLMAFNTIFNNGKSISGEGNRPYEPHDCVVANNVVVGGGEQLVTMPKGEVGFRWEGNILHGAAPGDIPATGYRLVDPLLVKDPAGIYRPAAGSPAIDAAVGRYVMVSRDIDRVGRGLSKDVGADEALAVGPRVRPLTPADVGPFAS